MIDSADIKGMYEEGCSALRHYSNCVINIVTITIAQGFVILTAAIYLIREKGFWSSISIAIFGLFFTVVLNHIQRTYWLHFEAVLTSVVELESLLGDKKGPWQAYFERRGIRYKQKRWRYLAANGPYYLLLVALISIIIVDIVKLLIVSNT